MQLSLQNFNTLRQNFAAGVQGACKYLIDFSDGSVLSSVGEASSSVGLWMQWLILECLSMTRLSTSNDDDVDSWVGDFSLSRLPGAYAIGTVTFSRFSAGQQAFIPAGSQVKTANATQVFTVIGDAAKTQWNAALNGYVMPAGWTSVDATVEAVSVGTQANVQAGAISLLASAITNIDGVSNSAAFANGVDAETDAALRARFTNYIQTRSLATLGAIAYAIMSVRQGLTWTIQENTNAIGDYLPGNILVTVDDGTGTPPSDLLATVLAAVNAVRPIGSTVTVRAPSVTTATISLSYTTTPVGAKTSDMTAAVQNAIVAYVNALPDGSPLVYTRLSGVAYSVDPAITAVENVLLNSGTSDLTVTQNGAIKASTGSVTVS